MRTPLQTTADGIDAQLKRLADRAETAGMDDAAKAIARARPTVREFMHPKDRESTPY
jgi:hypothetical protein